MGLFDIAESISRVSPDELATNHGSDVSSGEAFTTQAELAFDQHTFGNAGRALAGAFDEDIEAIEHATGKRLDNPFFPREGEVEVTGITPRRHIPSEDERIAAFYAQMSQLDGVPDRVSRSYSQLQERIAQQRQAQRNEAADVARRTRGVVPNVAGFAGSVAGTMSDPIVAGSMLIGAGAGTTVARAMLTEAAIGAASEVVVQTEVQATRSQVLEEADLGEAIQSVLLAGVGGAAFAGAARGIGAGIRSTRKLVSDLRTKPQTAEVRGAIHRAEADLRVSETNPYASTVQGAKVHETRLGRATDAVVAGRRPDFTDEPDAPVVRPVGLQDTVLSNELIGEVLSDFELKEVQRNVADLVEQAGREVAETNLRRVLDEGSEAEVASLVREIKHEPVPVQTLKDFIAERGLHTKRKDSLAKTAREAQAAGFPVRDADELKEALQKPHVVRTADTIKAQANNVVTHTRQALQARGIDVDAIADGNDLRARLQEIGTESQTRPSITAHVDVEPNPAEDLAALRNEFDADEAITITNPDGSERTITMKQLVREFEEEQAAIDVLGMCARSS